MWLAILKNNNLVPIGCYFMQKCKYFRDTFAMNERHKSDCTRKTPMFNLKVLIYLGSSGRGRGTKSANLDVTVGIRGASFLCVVNGTEN